MAGVRGQGRVKRVGSGDDAEEMGGFGDRDG
jgi:hypothetical protein